MQLCYSIMNNRYPMPLDWSLVQSFLMVAEEGSLTAAARKLGQSQPTVGRHIARVEESLGVVLFRRTRRGFELTDAGRAMLPAASQMAEAAAQLSLAAAGRDQTLSGVVRVTASVVMANYVLPELLVDIRRREPGIELELHGSDLSENLLFHEADIAVRMYRPEQLDIITRHLGDMELGIFAANSYIEHRGVPSGAHDLLNHDWVGYDKNEALIKGMREAGFDVDRRFFAVRCDDQAAYWRLLVAGAGIGVGQVEIASHFPEVSRLVPELEIPGIPLWLTASAMLHRTPRIRRVYDLLANHLTDKCVRLESA